jgi:aldose 1-epimerase
MIKRSVISNLEFLYIKLDSFEVSLSSLGASIFYIKLDDRYLTRTPLFEKDFIGPKMYDGKTIGRFANRIQGNVINIDGKSYILDANENGNTLHGGLNGLATKIFDSQIEELIDSVIVTYSYLSKDGESGFPGNLSIKVIYTIKNNSIGINFLATTDKTTCCSLTNHTYFTVGERSLNDTKLQINASKYLHCDSKELLPIEIRDVPSYLDFRQIRNIMDDISNPVLINSKAKGYDHHYYFDDEDVIKEKAILVGNHYKMKVFTNFKGMQIYSSNELTNILSREVDNVLHNSLAVEPQDGFLTLNILKPNEEYSRFIKYVFEKI